MSGETERQYLYRIASEIVTTLRFHGAIPKRMHNGVVARVQIPRAVMLQASDQMGAMPFDAPLHSLTIDVGHARVVFSAEPI